MLTNPQRAQNETHEEFMERLKVEQAHELQVLESKGRIEMERYRAECAGREERQDREVERFIRVGTAFANLMKGTVELGIAAGDRWRAHELAVLDKHPEYATKKMEAIVRLEEMAQNIWDKMDERSSRLLDGVIKSCNETTKEIIERVLDTHDHLVSALPLNRLPLEHLPIFGRSGTRELEMQLKERNESRTESPRTAA
jgi:hypothetical protein